MRAICDVVIACVLIGGEERPRGCERRRRSANKRITGWRSQRWVGVDAISPRRPCRRTSGQKRIPRTSDRLWQS